MSGHFVVVTTTICTELDSAAQCAVPRGKSHQMRLLHVLLPGLLLAGTTGEGSSPPPTEESLTINASLPTPVDLRPSVDQLQWHEVLEDVIRHAGYFRTVHVLCAYPEVCLQEGRLPGPDPILLRPHTLWNASWPDEPRLATEACGRDMSGRDLVLLVAPSNQTAAQLALVCKSNNPRYIVAWPYDRADPAPGIANVLAEALKVGRLRTVSMDVPVLAGAAASAMASVPGSAPLLFYRLQPYSALTPCLKQLRPLKVGAWRRGEGFVGNTTLFPSGELWHFQNCPLKVAVRLYPPFADLKRLKIPSAEGDVWEFRGQFTPLLRALEYGMHAHFNLSPMPDTGKPEAPVRSNFDLYLTRTLPDPEHRSEVPTTGRSGCYTVCVPRRWRQTPLWRALLAEFSAPVWALVIATFITMRLALTPILDERDRRRGVRVRNDVGFLLLAGVLGSVQASTPGYKPTRAASNRERSLFVMWLFFSLVMSTAYQAVQHSLRTAPQIVDSLRDLEVLAHSDVIINGPQVAMAALSQAPGGAMLLKRYRTYNFSGITTMKLSLDEAYMCSAFERFFLERKLGRDEAGRPFHVPVDNCMVSFAEAFIALPVGSFYLHKASEVILRMTETGITQHVIGRRTGDSVLLMKASDTAPGGPQREDLVQLSPALLLLGVGLGLAAAAFLLELAVASGACGRPGWWACAARSVAAVRREDPTGQRIAAAPPFKDELWPRRRLAAGNDHSATITADSWTLFLP